MTKIFHLSTPVVGMLALFLSVPLTAQDNSPKLTVNHAVASGISAPLRDLAKLPRAPQYGFHEANPVNRIPMRPPASVVDRVEQNAAGSSANYSTGINVLGLGNGFPNFIMRVAPPDTDMAVGDTQLIEYVNLSWEVFDKSGNPLIGPFDGNSLWASGIPGSLCALHDSGDPIVKWDRVAHRWLLFQNVFVSPYAMCIAVSTSADATGNYYVYQFSVPGNGFPDYQKIGVWPTGYFQANNNFGVNKSGFVGSQICAYNSVKLLAGDASAEQQCVQLTGGDYSLLPGDVDSPTPPPAGQDEFFIGGLGRVDTSHLSVPNGSLGYLTVWPAGQPRPLASTLNSLDGRIKANAAIIPAGASGEISVYATSTTNVIVDVNGYFAPVSSSTLAFYPLPPCRVADTRHSGYPQGLGPPSLTGGQERQFPILNATTCNIPSSAAAYSLNFSVVPHGPLGYMTVWPTGEPRPTVSTLNDIPGAIIANAAIVVAGTSGSVSVYPTNDTDLVVDINGYFAPASEGGLSLYGVQPCRVIDTRHVGNGQPFSGVLSSPVDVAATGCGTSSLAQAYVFNASVVPQGALGYLTLWPDGAVQPVVSTLNALDGSISSNMAIVPSTNGEVDAYASGLTQLILDISSYFAP